MALVLESGKWYITEGDYLVYITKDNDFLFASVETSPGYSISGRSVKDMYSDKHGWYYEADGSINGLEPEWCKALKIVAEYPKQLSLPEGYEWLDGYPKLYCAKDVIGKYIIRDDGAVISSNVFTSFFMSETSGTKRIGLVKKEATPVSKSTMPPKLELAVGKWYLTAGDYLVFLKGTYNDGGHTQDGLFASVETSPGFNTTGLTITEVNNAHPHRGQSGWVYRTYNHGEINGLSPEWNEKLRIVKEYTYPVVLPDGFEWKGGFPKLYTAEELSDCHYLSIDQNALKRYTDINFYSYEFGPKRIGLVKKETMTTPELKLEVGKWYVTKGDYLVNIVDKLNDDNFIASPETSPGTTYISRSLAKNCYPFNKGWSYKSSGKIASLLDSPWTNDLEIVAEYPHPINVSDRYEWKGGFPKLYDAKDIFNDWCILADGDVVENNSRSPFDDADVIGGKRIGLVIKQVAPMPTPTPTPPKIRLEAGKWYITAGGYIINIKKIGYGNIAYSTPETSPGAGSGNSWAYNIDGSIDGLGKKWEKELPIVAEYPYPVVIPDEFTWKGGYPKLYELSELNDSDCFLTVADIAATMSASVYKGPTSEHKGFDKIGTAGEKRIGLVKKNDVPSKELKLAVGKWYVTAGDYLVKIVSQTGSYFNASVETSPGCISDGRTVKEIYPQTRGWAYTAETKKPTCLKQEWIDALEIVGEYPYPVNLPDGYAWKDGFPKLYSTKELGTSGNFLTLDGNCFVCHDTSVNFFKTAVVQDKRIGLVKVDNPVESPVTVPTPTLIVESKEEMKKETAIKIASVAGSLGFRALNYWLFEPAVNTFRPVVKGVRYAVFLGTLASAVYGYKHPDVIKNAIMSCLPKISVEAPEILK